MEKLYAGYAASDITAENRLPIHGYYVKRTVKGILDRLEVSALTLTLGEERVVIVSVDNGGLKKQVADKIRNEVSNSTDIPVKNIFITATHTHTAPSTFYPEFFETEESPLNGYIEFLTGKTVEAVKKSLSDLRPAKIGCAVGRAPDRIAYIRRYRMKDGTTYTCPPINHPDIIGPIGKTDDRVNVIRIDREGSFSVVILNYGLHADTVNGEMISADWPGWVRGTVEKALDGTKCMCLIGAEGDVGSTNVHPLPGDMNDTEISFDNEMKSPGMARFVGRALAGTVLQVFDKVAYFNVDNIRTVENTITVGTNYPENSELPLAHKYKQLYESGRSDLIPYKGMQLTTEIARALRICKMENGPKTTELSLSGLRIGEIAFIGIPGEPFTDIGVKIKQTDGFGLIMPCAMANGYEGYFPSEDAFKEGGYEAATSPYKSDIAEKIISCAKSILNELKD